LTENELPDDFKNIVELDDYRPLEDLLQRRVGNKFAICFWLKDKVYSFVSSDLDDVEFCYLIDSLKKRRDRGL